MQVFSGKIEGGMEGVISTYPSLSNRIIGVSEMSTTKLPQSPNSIKICLVAGCVQTYRARGCCARHLHKLNKYGDPYAVGRGLELTDEQRFWRDVKKTPTCWLWVGSQKTGKDGSYGKTKVEGKWVKAHRYSYFLANGYWPEPFCLHSCDNPPCVNPAHLRAGTFKDNSVDRLERGRLGRVAKLSVTDVQTIRRLLSGGIRQKEIALRFGVHQSSIHAIKARKSWRHVEW